MSKLVERLRAGPLKDGEGVNNDDQAWDWWCDITDAAADTIEAQSKLIEELREAVIDLRDVYTKGVLHMMSGDRGDERLIRAINSANERMDAALSKANPHSEKVE